jgi:hypothetical protein
MMFPCEPQVPSCGTTALGKGLSSPRCSSCEPPTSPRRRNTWRQMAWLLSTLLFVSAVGHAAPPPHVVDSDRLCLGDLAPKLPDYLARFDLGEAPPPGGAKVFLRKDILQKLHAAGIETDRLVLPASVRVVGATQRWEREPLAQWLSDHISASLPKGVTLLEASPYGALTTSPSAVAAAVHLPRLPKHPGRMTTTAVIELHREGKPLQQVSLSVVLDISASAARWTVEKGEPIELSIDVGSAHVSARATALSSGDVGDRVSVRVAQTRRTLEGIVVSRREVRLVEP